MLKINLLGGFRLTSDDASVPAFNTSRLQELLAYLVLHRESPQSRQHLAFLLWPDSAEAQARTNLRNLIHLLRHSLPCAEDCLQIDATTLHWRPGSAFQLDVADFEQAVSAGVLSEAITLYQGELLPDCYDDWIIPERERLQQIYIEALRQSIIQKESNRDYQAAIECTQRLLRSEPLREEVYQDLMRLYALSDDRIGIVRAYDRCTTILRKELGLEPSVGTRAAYEHCLQLSSTHHSITTPGLSSSLDHLGNNLLIQSTPPFEPGTEPVKNESLIGASHPVTTLNIIRKSIGRVLTVILAGGASNSLSILLEKRAKPALPIGGQYQVIDFSLSNVANSELQHVAVAMQHQPHSLIKHLGKGEPWDLAHAHSPGLEIWQPYRGRQDQGWYRGTADVLYQNRDFIREADSELVLILAADQVYKQDYREFLSFHMDHQADLTIATMPVRLEEAPRFGMLSIDADRRITDFIEKPTKPSSTLASLGIYIFRTSFLLNLLEDDARDSTSRHDFGQNIIPRVIKHDRAFAYPFSGYWADIGSIVAYWGANLALLANHPELDLDDPHWPIHTRVEARPPVNCRPPSVIENSLVSNGCVIEGTVINSVLSPGVRVAQRAVVRDSVIMADTVIETGAWVERCILDEEVTMGAGAQLGIGHDNTPNQLEPLNLYAGITVVGRRAHVRADALIGLNCRIDPDVTPEDFMQREVPSGGTVSLRSSQA